MSKFLLFAVLLSGVGCQKLRQDIDDLKLRCGVDANLGDVEEWIEVATDYGKPSPSSVRAAAISDNFTVTNLPISSRGCVGRLKESTNGWVSFRVEEGGSFGRVVPVKNNMPRRLLLSKIPEGAVRLECSTKEYIGNPEFKDQQVVSLDIPETLDKDSIVVQARLPAGAAAGENSYTLLPMEQSRNSLTLDVSRVAEGKYTVEISAFELLNFRGGLKPISKNCPLTVDRTTPQFKLITLSSQGGSVEAIRVSPGQSLDFKVEDSTDVRIFTCIAQAKQGVSECTDFVESGRKLSAPSEGEWILHTYAVDAAGNRSGKQTQRLVVFDSEKIRKASGWIEEARLYIKQKDFLSALMRVTQVSRFLATLSSDDEKRTVREKLFGPMMQILQKNVPYAIFGFGGQGVGQVFPAEKDRLIVTTRTAFNYDASVVLLIDMRGQIVQKLDVPGYSGSALNTKERTFVIFSGEGSYRVYDLNLELLRSGINPLITRDNVSSLEYMKVSGGSVELIENNAIFLLNLETMEKSKVAEKFPVHDISPTGKWILTSNQHVLYVHNNETKVLSEIDVGFIIKRLRFAAKSDVACIEGDSNLWCGGVEEILNNTPFLVSKSADYGAVLSNDGSKVGYKNKGSVLLFNRNDQTHFYKSFTKTIYRLFFDEQNDLKVDSAIGRIAWSDLVDFDPPSLDAGWWTMPMLKDDQYWIKSGSAYITEYVGENRVSIYTGSPLQLEKELRFESESWNFRNALLTADNQYLVIPSKNALQIYSTGIQLNESFMQPCNRMSSDGKFCAWVYNNSVKVGQRLRNTHAQDFEMHEFPKSDYWQDILFNPKKSGLFVIWKNAELAVGSFRKGELFLDDPVKFESSVLQIQWLNEKLLAFIDSTPTTTQLKVYDIESKKFVLSRDTSIQISMFYPPVDFSPELGLLATVVQDEKQNYILEFAKVSDASVLGRWVFPDTNINSAEIVKFSESSEYLLLGFHDGTIRILSSQEIKSGNFEPSVFATHMDSITYASFLNGNTHAFSLSLDSTALFHDLSKKQSKVMQRETPFPNSDAILYAGTMPGREWAWVSDSSEFRVFDTSGNVIESIKGGGFLSGSNLLGLGGSRGNVAIDLNDLEYADVLCRWLRPSIRNGLLQAANTEPICL